MLYRIYYLADLVSFMRIGEADVNSVNKDIVNFPLAFS